MDLGEAHFGVFSDSLSRSLATILGDKSFMVWGGHGTLGELDEPYGGSTLQCRSSGLVSFLLFVKSAAHARLSSGDIRDRSGSELTFVRIDSNLSFLRAIFSVRICSEVGLMRMVSSHSEFGRVRMGVSSSGPEVERTRCVSSRPADR